VPVAYEEQDVSVGRDFLGGTIERRHVAEVNCLRELYDTAIAKGRQYGLPELLMIRPDIAKIPAAMDQNGALRHRAPQRVRREVTGAADISRCDSMPGAKPLELAEIDRAVTHVGMIGKIDEGERVYAIEFRRERPIDIRLKPLKRRNGPAPFCFRPVMLARESTLK
jgi:hypothetical protein